MRPEFSTPLNKLSGLDWSKGVLILLVVGGQAGSREGQTAINLLIEFSKGQASRADVEGQFNELFVADRQGKADTEVEAKAEQTGKAELERLRPRLKLGRQTGKTSLRLKLGRQASQRQK
ncbi:hypothetical protein BY996DRAFT_6603557 [Phakopsora pachyrhizi]|uniref:Uncharacterized protein n=1 Tax=Phakopsora pachyrhizi TaxID=170000 RepID=A0AAV0BDB0_PHAPC|nr:hypothetical protein BY996DRAFT_6603557 [Phakopsora pachyrhizi]CAH7685268.1 hypothetical protein PPACK8108_LOCUS19759 [Phakopsora pachyrhizi]